MARMQNPVVLLLAITLPCAVPPQAAAGMMMGRYTLNPKAYKSPSGAYELRIDPGTIYGQGEGSYCLTRDGQEVWAKKLPFTLWDAGVTDDGIAAGYAYSLGRQNEPLEPMKPDQPFDTIHGELHLVILDPTGAIRTDDVLPRNGMESCMSRIDRSATGFILDAPYDRFIARTLERQPQIVDEIWHTYRLSTGERQNEFTLIPPRERAYEYWFVRSARLVAGTPLVLVNWEYSKYDEDEKGPHRIGDGSCFALIDPAGKIVWKLDRPGDYPQYADYQGAPDEPQKLMLNNYLDEHGAILRTDQPGRFDVWFVSAGQSVTFEVTQDPTAAEAWRVTEVSRAPYMMPKLEEPIVEVPRIDLKHVGTIKLQASEAPPPVRDIRAFALDQRGRFGFVRAEQGAVNTFVLVEPDGQALAEIPLPAEASGCPGFAPLACVRDERWIVAADRPQKDDPVTAWWVNVAAKNVKPIQSFNYHVTHVVGLTNGRFVITDEPQYDHARLVCLDESAKTLWTIDGLEHCDDLAVLRDGRIAVLADNEITYVDQNGARTGSLNLRPIQPKDAWSANGLSADNHDGLIVQFNFASPRVWRINADGTERGRFDPRYPDGRTVTLAGLWGAGISAAPDGQLWASDESAFLRLTDEGVVDQIIGEPPDAPVLRAPGDIAVDTHGFLYVPDRRNSFVHVFDPTGKRVRVCEPNPDDFPEPVWGPLSVAGDGTLYLRDVQFSADGRRIGKVSWPGDFFPGSQKAWQVWEEYVTLRDDRGQPAKTITRRPGGQRWRAQGQSHGGDWLNQIKSHATAPDGSLALLTDAFDVEQRGDPSIQLYTPQGDPVRTLTPPNIEGARHLGKQIAFTGRFVLIELLNDVLIADLKIEPPSWSVFAQHTADLDWSRFLLAPDGKELWIFSLKQNQIERYELPAAGLNQ